jgi:hypothetical protein
VLAGITTKATTPEASSRTAVARRSHGPLRPIQTQKKNGSLNTANPSGRQITISND